MDITKQVVALVMLLAFSSSEGVTHGVLWSLRGAKAFDWNEHRVFVAGRAAIAIAAIIGATVYTIAGWVLAYSFFHNGAYYLSRNEIDGSYPRRWWDKSTSSTADINLGPILRAVLFGLGLIVFFLQFII